MNIKLLASCFCIFVLTGCVNLLPDPGSAPLRLDLKPIDLPEASKISAEKPAFLKINIPTSNESLDSLKINVTRNENEIIVADHLANVEWKDHLPLLVQQKMLQLIQGTGRFQTLGLQTEKFKATHLLQLHIQHFGMVLKDQEDHAYIEIMATIILQMDHKPLHQKTFKIHTPALENSLTGFLKTLDKGFQDFQQEFAKWIMSDIKIS